MAPDRQLTDNSGVDENPAAAAGETGHAGETELPLHVRNRAAELVKSPEDLQELIEQARAKADSAGASANPLAAVIEDLKTMFELLRAVGRGSYRLRKETLILIAGAVLYFVIPIDLIPDFIPVAGFLDDAAVIAWVVKTCKTEIALFRALTAADDETERSSAANAPMPTP